MHRSLFRRVHPALLVVLCALALIGPALAIMTNGMAASLVLGQPDFTTNTTATSAEGMRGPFGVAVDPTTGKVFVTDTFNSRVLRFASVAALSNGAAAEGVLGQPDFSTRTQAVGASAKHRLNLQPLLNCQRVARRLLALSGMARPTPRS